MEEFNKLKEEHLVLKAKVRELGYKKKEELDKLYEKHTQTVNEMNEPLQQKLCEEKKIFEDNWIATNPVYEEFAANNKKMTDLFDPIISTFNPPTFIYFLFFNDGSHGMRQVYTSADEAKTMLELFIRGEKNEWATEYVLNASTGLYYLKYGPMDHTGGGGLIRVPANNPNTLEHLYITCFGEGR